MNGNNVLYNEAGRLRSGWRFAVFMFGLIFFGTFTGFFLQKVFAFFEISYSPGNLLYLLLNSSVSLVLALFVGWLCGRTLEDLPFRALGASLRGRWYKDLFWGVVFGTFSILLACTIAFAAGGLRFELNQNHGTSAIALTLVVTFLVFAIAAAFEEALFRGYALQTFARADLAWLAIAMTSAFFALAHYNNPGATAFSTLNTALAGVWLGVAYLKTRTLWFPFGLHLMWNWVMGSFFGIEVSGLKNLITAPLLREIDFGPIWLTGEDYGLEGGLPCTVAIVVSTLAIRFAPFLRPTEEMLALTSRENPAETAADFRQ